MKTLSHPLLQGPPLEERTYQRDVAAACLQESTLAVLPTGLGKTVIALQVMLERLELGRVLMMAPTRPLAEQHATFLKRSLDVGIELFTGSVPPTKREPLWQSTQVVVATPQVVEKDLIRGTASLDDFALVVFDEAHRAVGNYAYVFIARNYAETARQPLVLGMTASPGSTRTSVTEVCVNLHITAIEKRDDNDPDVAPYIQPIETNWVRVPLPESAARISK
ncbi:MAG: DEAD/DEAH box helicase, partial [Candidatus Thermoplasmatota archaeon]|nr:DEAD/DEAH box helicase [Candidatus Thermoplasmatota archaeon]